MNEFLTIDQQIFLFLNRLPHNDFFDSLALLVSGVGTAGIVWFVLSLLLFLREEKKDHRFVGQVVAIGVATWLAVEEFLKPLLARPRPTAEMGAIIVGGATEGFSFPSGHAAIAFAMAVLLSQKEPRRRWAFYVLAAAISFSRIYIGVHYPLDVGAGGLIGWVIGWSVLRLVMRRDGGGNG